MPQRSKGSEARRDALIPVLIIMTVSLMFAWWMVQAGARERPLGPSEASAAPESQSLPIDE